MLSATILAIPSAYLKRRCSREQRAVDSIDNRLSRDLSTAEETSIETFDGVLTTLDAVELEVDVACGVLI